jgi:transposase
MLPEINAEPGKKSKGAGQRPQKRRYSLDYKLQVVRETLAPGASVSVVARRHDINSNVVFCWRKLFREGALGGDAARGDLNAVETGFIPIHVMEAPRVLPALRKAGSERVKASGPVLPGLIEIETAGGVKLRLSGRVDERSLRCVLSAIGRLS